VVDGGLSVLNVEGRGFEKDFGAGCSQPGMDIMWRGYSCTRAVGRTRSQGKRRCGIDSVRIRNPTQSARSDSRNAEVDFVADMEFLSAVFKQADQRTVDVAEAEEAEVVNVDGQTSRFQSFKVSKSHRRLLITDFALP
jgi:hypothetical protein